MRYDASKTLKENKEIIFENPNTKESISNNVKNEGGIKCNSLDDYLKKKMDAILFLIMGKIITIRIFPTNFIEILVKLKVEILIMKVIRVRRFLEGRNF
jgi:hypothetical protein